jgi:hypothetical protein
MRDAYEQAAPDEATAWPLAAPSLTSTTRALRRSQRFDHYNCPRKLESHMGQRAALLQSPEVALAECIR